MSDFYNILGVSKDADAKQIKSAYRKKANQYHPDKNPGNKAAEQKFKEASAAYEVLKDPEKKRVYDQVGHEGFMSGMNSGNSSGGFDFASDIFEQFFGDMMGGRGGRPSNTSRNNKGNDVRHDINITLEDAYSGVEMPISYMTFVSCNTCHGTGAAKGYSPTICDHCGGSGTIRTQRGFFMMEHSCPHCGGTGKVIEKPCLTCHGSGRNKQRSEIKVKVPSGVEDGMQIRLAGKGEAGFLGGRAGDLYLFVNIKPHDFFIREDHHLLCNVPVSMVRAALGGDVEVPSIDGSALKIKIDEGTQSGKRVRLRGKGMPIINRSGIFGDLYVNLNVETPINLNRKQKDILMQFADGCDEKAISPNASGFLDKISKWFG
jgi:molecular chaperone DnaJ